jgi:PAP2 superfamily
VVSTGRELARLFEIETPGLYHHHALNYLFYKRPELSPPRQARVWMALDVTIYSALLAAWYYKWAASPDRYGYRQRPYEYDQNQSFRVLFDDIVDDAGRFNKCPRTMPCPSPGTPRHPAFPSGHSTFSAAASEILAYFFPEERGQWDNLANNIGTARLWAGVHWRSDHIAGQRIGRAVARRMIEQLQGDCIPRPDETLNRIPTPDELRDQATRRRNEDECDPRQDQLPTQRRGPFNDCEESLKVF